MRAVGLQTPQLQTAKATLVIGVRNISRPKMLLWKTLKFFNQLDKCTHAFSEIIERKNILPRWGLNPDRLRGRPPRSPLRYAPMVVHVANLTNNNFQTLFLFKFYFQFVFPGHGAEFTACKASDWEAIKFEIENWKDWDSIQGPHAYETESLPLHQWCCADAGDSSYSMQRGN